MSQVFLRETSKGRAVYAARSFQPGESILKFHGEIYSAHDDPPGLNADLNHYLQIGVDRFMGPSDTADNFVNHSCDPNAAVHIREDGVFLVALKEIHPDQEITFDYSTTMVEDDWTMQCLCGSPRCRKEIQEFWSLPEALRTEYIEKGMVPDFVLNIREK